MKGIEKELREMFKLGKRVCAGIMAAVTLGVTLLPGVESYAAAEDLQKI